MKGKIVLVTGASAGIGKSIAQFLAKKGFTVVGAARRVEKMKDLKSEGVYTVKLDVTNTESIDECLKEVRENVGEIDILINNAGIELLGPFELLTMEEGRRLLDVNLFGVLEMTKRCLPYMREKRWGRIINVTSIGGVGSMPYNSWYHLSKHAIEGFTRSLRQEVAQFGIAAVTIRPGSIQTDIWDGGVTKKRDWNSKDYQKTMDNLLVFMKKQDVKLGGDPVSVARVTYKAIIAKKPKLSYAAPMHAKVMLFLTKYIFTESFGNRLAGKATGVPFYPVKKNK
jgi:NAD(P)-dependent dehydrogenase (short-subunit alcohol dehydrogenase family)